MRKIAVTGGLATGKSTLCGLLKDFGAYVISADEIVRQLLTTENPVSLQVIKLLGPVIITNNKIDRKKISNIVFSNPLQLKSLESILHPAVRHEINQCFETVKNNKNYRFFVAEVPLLYEARMEDDFDTVIAVETSEKTAKERLANGDEFERRSRFQLPPAAKSAKATYTIKNDGDLLTLKAQVAALIPQLL